MSILGALLIIAIFGMLFFTISVNVGIKDAAIIYVIALIVAGILDLAILLFTR